MFKMIHNSSSPSGVPLIFAGEDLERRIAPPRISHTRKIFTTSHPTDNSIIDYTYYDKKCILKLIHILRLKTVGGQVNYCLAAT
jgi:hypothetical protein